MAGGSQDDTGTLSPSPMFAVQFVLIGAPGARCLLYGGVNVPSQGCRATYTHGGWGPGVVTRLPGVGEPLSCLAGCTGRDAEAVRYPSPVGAWCRGSF